MLVVLSKERDRDRDREIVKDKQRNSSKLT